MDINKLEDEIKTATDSQKLELVKKVSESLMQTPNDQQLQYAYSNIIQFDMKKLGFDEYVAAEKMILNGLTHASLIESPEDITEHGYLAYYWLMNGMATLESNPMLSREYVSRFHPKLQETVKILEQFV